MQPNVTTDKSLKVGYKRKFNPEATQNLTGVSCLYIYTGTPPHGYGTQAPKVAETVIRTEEYNRKKENKSITIGGIDISRTMWNFDRDGPFPHDQVHSNYVTTVLREMCTDFLRNHGPQIDATVEAIMLKVKESNADTLTQGRQTFCPFKRQSVTASQAYEEALNFLEVNTDTPICSMLDWISATLSCFEKTELKVREATEIEVTRTIYDPETHQKITTKTKSKKMVDKLIKGELNVKKKMADLVCQFASYIKHKERGKKDRRAIASATMLLRPLLYIVELFHLELAKRIPGSTISIGGEEKKAKITNNMESTRMGTGVAAVICQGTEDATKWNECLSPAQFALMHHYLFDEMTRLTVKGLHNPPINKVFLSIAWKCHLFQAWKQVQLGPGVLIVNNK